MNYSKEIFKKLGIKPNEIFQTSLCDEFVYKMNEDLKGYYFNLNEGEIGANINDKNSWRDYPALLSNLLTGATEIVEMDRSTKIFVNELLAIPVPEKKETLGNALLDILTEVQKECPSVDLTKDNLFTKEGEVNILAAIAQDTLGLSKEEFKDLYYGD